MSSWVQHRWWNDLAFLWVWCRLGFFLRRHQRRHNPQKTHGCEPLHSHRGGMASVNRRDNKVIMCSPSQPQRLSLSLCLSRSFLIPAPHAASWSFFISFFFDWSEWFSPATHLRKTDDNAVAVIYGDFTKINMSGAFSSCKCGCEGKTSLSLSLSQH